MLILPPHGFQRSVKEHNVKLDALADWIEASIVFVNNALSQSDVADVLLENTVYEKQDFALERVADAWIELNRRSQSLSPQQPWRINQRRIERVHGWEDAPTYSFCVLLAVQVMYTQWARAHADYAKQGDLFEKITEECLQKLGWTTHRTGWAPGTAAKIKKIVQGICTHIRESEIPDALTKWVSDHANEEGLDIVCSDPFADNWGGRSLYFFQCASGADWPNKLHTPDPDTWRRVIDFTNIPKRGFAMPFALLDDDFRRNAGKINGVLLDRFRLHSPAIDGNANWASVTLTQEIINWMRPRVTSLPLGN